MLIYLDKVVTNQHVCYMFVYNTSVVKKQLIWLRIICSASAKKWPLRARLKGRSLTACPNIASRVVNLFTAAVERYGIQYVVIPFPCHFPTQTTPLIAL